MALVGAILFCTDCGNLLERKPPATKTIGCEICEKSNPNNWPVSTQTMSKPDAFPSSLQRKRGDIQTLDPDAGETWPTISQACPACSNPEMLFREMQLRGADEGTTIFYRCPKCNHRSKSDN